MIRFTNSIWFLLYRLSSRNSAKAAFAAARSRPTKERMNRPKLPALAEASANVSSVGKYCRQGRFVRSLRIPTIQIQMNSLKQRERQLAWRSGRRSDSSTTTGDTCQGPRLPCPSYYRTSRQPIYLTC